MKRTCRVLHPGGDREAWLAARQGLLTASDTASVMGMNPHRNAKAVFLEKTGQKPIADLRRVPAVQSGVHLEEGIFNWWLADTGRKGRLCGKLLQSLDSPWLGATLDGLARDGGETVVVEVKNTGERSRPKWEGNGPQHYWCQVQTQLYVRGLQRGWLVGCVGGTSRIDIEVVRDERFLKNLLDETKRFWDTVLAYRELS